MSLRNLILLGIGIALALYLLVFGRVLDNYFTGDDWAFLDEVSQAHALSDIAAFFSFGTLTMVRPLEKVITWLLFSGFGLNFVIFHLVSLLLDLTNTALLGFLSFLLFRSEKHSDLSSLFWASTVTILFSFNWTHHEAVFWYSALNEPLTAFFRLSGNILYVLILPRRDVPVWATGAVIVLLALLALFAKESAIVFPLELLLFFLYFRVMLPTGQVRRADVVVLVLVTLVAAGWIILYWTGAPAGVIESGRGGVKLTLGSLQDWLMRVPLMFNSTIIGLGVLSTQWRIQIELVAGVVLFVLALVRRRWVWVLALAWTIVLTLPYAALFPANLMLAYLPVTTLTAPDRYFYLITAGSGLLLVASGMWLLQEFNALVPNRLLQNGAQALLCLGFVGLVALNVPKLVTQENEWDISGQTLLRLSRQLQPVVTSLHGGDTLCLVNLPDNYRFKLVFRNATWGVLHLTYHRSDYTIVALTDADSAVAMEQCTVHLNYDPTSDTFVRD